jgi:GNAT superfamily N-acetyltransferase
VLEPRELAIAWRHAKHAAVCDRIEPWAQGTLVRATAIGSFWDFNLVRMETADAPLGARAIAAVADDWLEGLEHRRVEIEDEGLGTRLRPEFQEIGYSVERLLWMLREDEPPDAVPGVQVEEVSLDDTRPLHEDWLIEEGIGLDSEFLDAEQRLAAKRGLRVLAVVEDSAPVAYLRIIQAGDEAEIDDVFCTPARRGTGLGSALLRAALRETAAAGARRTFIGADDEGRPKGLYARLGFRAAWVQHTFTRRP